MATAVSARVDFYSLTLPKDGTTSKNYSLLRTRLMSAVVGDVKPMSSLFKFKDAVTAIKLRQDGNLILCGEKLGKIQIIQIDTKFSLREYNQFKKYSSQ